MSGPVADMQPSPTATPSGQPAVPLSVVGQPGGVAQLDSTGVVPDAQVEPAVARVVVHGAVAGTARPATATFVHWIGSVAPTNVATNDEWTDTANKITKRWNGASFDTLGSAASSAITRTVIPITSATADRAILLDVPAQSLIVAFDLQIVSADTTTRDNMDISFQKDDGTGDEGANIAYPYAAMDPANPLDPHWAGVAFLGTAFLGGATPGAMPAVPVHDTKIRLYRFDTGGVPGDGVYDFIVDWIPSPPA